MKTGPTIPVSPSGTTVVSATTISPPPQPTIPRQSGRLSCPFGIAASTGPAWQQGRHCRANTAPQRSHCRVAG